MTRRFDLDKLSTLDFAVSHWDGMEFVAHTMLSFGFEDGRHLALSVETRLPEGVEQGTIPGLYKQFNVIYILADEEDLFGLAHQLPEGGHVPVPHQHRAGKT